MLTCRARAAAGTERRAALCNRSAVQKNAIKIVKAFSSEVYCFHVIEVPSETGEAAFIAQNQVVTVVLRRAAGAVRYSS